LNRPSCLSGCNSLLMPEQKVQMDQPVSVEALPLDEIVHEKVDLIKIDAEGAEPFILEGMHEVIANSPGLKIVMELNVPMIRKTVEPATFLHRIRELGFTLRVISEQGVLENLDDDHLLQTPISNLLLERPAASRPRVGDASLERISPKPHLGAAAPKTRRPGVLVRGIVYGGSGYADETLATVLRLAQHLPVELQPIYEQTDRMNLLSPSTRDRLELLRQPRVNLSQSVALQWIMAHGFNLQLPGRKRVGRTMFATDRLPKDWVPLCQSMDEIWVPSEFNRRTFSSAGVDETRLRVMSAGVDTKLFQPGREPLELARKRSFAFLSVFEWTDRKAPEVLLRAYFREFKPDEDVTLILRTHPRPGPNADLPARIAEIAEREAGVPVGKIPSTILMPHFLAAADVPRLYATADAFVLPSRGEGYGRPYLEALACGCPVIATGWGGQSDFLNNENSYLVESKIVPVPPNVDVPLFAGHCWAEPDVDHLRQLMRHVFTHRNEAKAKADLGRAEIAAQWDWDVVVRRWVAEIERLLA
jgi:glycosyltransferase involved in cell wall biosynthesis